MVAGASGALVILLVPSFSSSTEAAPKLLSFQGRLTNSDGTPILDGAKVVQFKIFDAPTGGTAQWSGEIQKLTVNGGLVSTLLGSKADLSGVDFNQALYLEITVDAQTMEEAGHGEIGPSDPPLLPRQSILPVVFAVEALNARDSVKLAGADWSSLMVDGEGEATNSPGIGFVKGARIQTAGITNTHLAANSVDADKIVDGSVGNADLSADAATPPGTVIAYAASDEPPGWLLCDGRAVSRKTYESLYNKILTKHGEGDGANTFNLPDYRGRFLRGVDDPDGAGGLAAAGRDPDASSRTAMSTGGVAGNAVGSVQSDALQGHTHAAGNLRAAVYLPPSGNFGMHARMGSPGFTSTSALATNAAVDGAAVGQSAEVFGSSGNLNPPEPIASARETRPKNAYVNYLIKH